jgi:tellurite methyltransferase
VSEIMDLSDKTPYKKTPIFNKKNVPKAILEKHNTKEGVWGKLVVVSGTLKFIDLEKDEEVVLDKGEFQIIEPTKWHKVVLIDNVEFFIEFYK